MIKNVSDYFGKTDRYEDIMHLPHHVSGHHPQMPEGDRAAQFAPFAALTGYEDAIREAARLTDPEILLDEEVKAQLDRKLEFLEKHLSEQPEITVTYFCPDSRKDGGAYHRIRGKIRRIDPVRKVLCMTDGREIRMEHISDIYGDMDFLPYV